MATFLRMDKIKENAHIESVKVAVDVRLGNVVQLGKLVDGEREVVEGNVPTDLTGEFVVISNPYVPYDERLYTKEGDYVIKAGEVARGHVNEQGDIITESVDVALIEGTVAVGKFVSPQVGKVTLKVADTKPACSLVYEVMAIEPFHGGQGAVLRVVK